MHPLPIASRQTQLHHRLPQDLLPESSQPSLAQRGKDRRGQRGDHLFVAMRTAFRPTGGVARGEDLAGWMAARQRGDHASLARMIVNGDVISFEWNDSFWLPMFQFDPVDLSIRPGPRQVVKELHDDCDGWTLSAWFARPNGWLDDSAPVDRIASDLPAVLNAARADRFVVTG